MDFPIFPLASIYDLLLNFILFFSRLRYLAIGTPQTPLLNHFECFLCFRKAKAKKNRKTGRADLNALT